MTTPTSNSLFAEGIFDSSRTDMICPRYNAEKGTIQKKNGIAKKHITETHQ